MEKPSLIKPIEAQKLLIFVSIVFPLLSHSAFGVSLGLPPAEIDSKKITLSSNEGKNPRRSFSQLKQKKLKKKSFKSIFNDPEKKWNVSWTSAYSRGASWLSKGRWSNSWGFSYKFSQISVSMKGAYLYPLSKVTETSFFGLTDISITGGRSFKDFKGWNVIGNVGVSLPTSGRARKQRQNKYASLHGSVSYKRKWKALQFSVNHILYGGLYGARSDQSGFRSNPLLSTSHSLSLVFPYKKMVFSGLGRFYVYFYLADMNKDPSVEQTEFKLDGKQGVSFQTTYNATRRWSVYGRADLNIPIVSPVLTGQFPLTHDRNWQWSLGTTLKL